MNPEELKRRGEHARQLLDDPLLNETIELIEKDIIEAWIACPIRDTEGQRLLLQEIRQARKLKGVLTGVMETGKYEAYQQSLKDKALNFIRR